MMLNNQFNDIVERIAFDLDLDKRSVKIAVFWYWKFIEDKRGELGDLRKIPEDDIKEMVTGFRINAIGNLFTTTRRIRASKTVSESIELWKAAKAERKKAKKKEKKLDKRRLKD